MRSGNKRKYSRNLLEKVLGVGYCSAQAAYEHVIAWQYPLPSLNHHWILQINLFVYILLLNQEIDNIQDNKQYLELVYSLKKYETFIQMILFSFLLIEVSVQLI